MAAMFFDGSNFWEQFLKKVTQMNIRVKLFPNRTSSFREEDFFYEFLYVGIVQKVSGVLR